MKNAQRNRAPQPTTPWYQNRWVQLATAATTGAAAAGTTVYALSPRPAPAPPKIEAVRCMSNHPEYIASLIKKNGIISATYTPKDYDKSQATHSLILQAVVQPGSQPNGLGIGYTVGEQGWQFNDNNLSNDVTVSGLEVTLGANEDPNNLVLRDRIEVAANTGTYALINNAALECGSIFDPGLTAGSSITITDTTIN